MRQRPGQPRSANGGAPACARPSSAVPKRDDDADAVPPGAPHWITPSLVALTKKVWNPRYKSPLSTPDAVTILLNTGRLFGVLAGE